MKRLALLSLLASFMFFTACQNDSPITGPQNSEFQKSKTAEPQWIGLPQAADKSLLKTFATSGFISKSNGGQLTISPSYYSWNRGFVQTYSSISFAPGCVKEDVYIDMQIDDKTGVTTLLPHQEFNFPAILNQTFIGLNLDGLDVENIKLYYLALDGTYEVMQCDQLIVNKSLGLIQVVNGRIPHFSLYGYGI